MATVKAFIRTTTKNKDVNVRFRLSDGRNIQLFHVSEILVNPNDWDAKREAIKAKVLYDESQRISFNNSINERKDLVLRVYNAEANKDILTSEWLETAIDKGLHPEKYNLIPVKQTFFETFDEFLGKRKLSDVRKKNFRVIVRALQRYELYIRKTAKRDFTLSLDTITPDTLRGITDFLRKENEIRKVYPEIYNECPQYHDQKPRGQNTINDILTKMRTFFLWAVDNDKTANNPFKKYPIEECVYGTPNYLFIDERNKLYYTDLSHRPELETQRDIFVFQCLIGCRVADLYKFTQQNVINGAIEYIAGKTKDGRPKTLRVPLNTIAKEILNKYADFEGKTLFPYISDQKYNQAIKKAFTIAGLTRKVSTLDPLTREQVIRPLNEIASSHMARRSFIANLYRQVKDPNLVGALSGHKEGSKAFVRYREIDEDMKKELVEMLE